MPQKKELNEGGHGKRRSNAPKDHSDNQAVVDGMLVPSFIAVNQHGFLKPSHGLTPDGKFYMVVGGRDNDGEFQYSIFLSDKSFEMIHEKASMTYSFTDYPFGGEPRWSNKSIKDYIAGTHKHVAPLDIFKSIRAQFERFCDYEEPGYSALLTLFTMITYLHRITYSLPILYITGEPGSGKTRTSTIIEQLAYNSNMGDFSPAALRRMISAASPTLIIDDAEFLNPENKAEASIMIQQLLRRNYKTGSKDMLVNKNTHSLETYDIFSPSVISCVTYLEKALETRTIEIRMIPSLKCKVNELLPPPGDFWNDMRDDCYLFALENWSDFKKAYEDMKTPDHLQGRDFEIWRPMLAMAQIVGKEVFDEVLEVSKLLIESSEERYVSNFSHELVVALAEIVKERRQTIEGMSDKQEITYSEIMGKIRDKFQRENQFMPEYFTPKKLGHALSRFGFKPKRDILRKTNGRVLIVTPTQVNNMMARYRIDEEPMRLEEKGSVETASGEKMETPEEAAKRHARDYGDV